MLIDKLKEIGFDENEANIYLELLDNAGSTAGNLAKRVSMPRATLYDTLKRMVDKGLVLRTLRRGIRYFSAENPEKILQTLKVEVSKKERTTIEFEKLMPDLIGLTNNKKSKTNIKIFEGIDAIRKILDDMHTYKDIESWSYWPISKMIDHLSADFFYHHNKMRIKNNIYTYAIWPYSEVINIKQFPYLGFGPEFKREIRVTPKSIKFTMGYWMYANKIAFISSKKEGYGMLVESKEMVDMMKTQHQMVWGVSTPITDLPDESIRYILEISKKFTK